MLDQLREPALPAAPVSDLILTDTSLQKILIAPNHSQGVFIDMEHDFLVENPKIIPKSKFNNNNILCDTLSGGFYLYNALNLLASPDYPSGLTNIIIPQRLVGETDIKNISWMMLEGEIIYPKKVNMFITKNIIQTSQTSK